MRSDLRDRAIKLMILYAMRKGFQADRNWSALLDKDQADFILDLISFGSDLKGRQVALKCKIQSIYSETSKITYDVIRETESIIFWLVMIGCCGCQKL